MIELVANVKVNNLVSLTLTQDDDQVDIRANGELIAFFEVTEGKIKLQLCESMDTIEDLDGKLHLNDLGQIVAE